MTPQQRKLYDYLWARRHEATPSYDEMAEHLELKSKSGVARVIDGLIARGAATKPEGGRQRAVRVLPLPGGNPVDETEILRMIAALRERGFVVTAGLPEEKAHG